MWGSPWQTQCCKPTIGAWFIARIFGDFGDGLWLWDANRVYNKIGTMARCQGSWSNIAILVLDLCCPSIGCFEMMPTDHVFLAGLVKLLPITFIVPMVFSISSFGHPKGYGPKSQLSFQSYFKYFHSH